MVPQRAHCGHTARPMCREVGGQCLWGIRQRPERCKRGSITLAGAVNCSLPVRFFNSNTELTVVDNNNILPLNVKPKQRTDLYRKVHIYISYSPPDKQWAWHFTISQTITYDGTGESFDDAVEAARKKVDMVKGPQPPHSPLPELA